MAKDRIPDSKTHMMISALKQQGWYGSYNPNCYSHLYILKMPKYITELIFEYSIEYGKPCTECLNNNDITDQWCQNPYLG